MPARHVEDHKWWTLTAVCVATFMLLIDITIVNVALPDIAKALHSSFTDLQWVIDAYALSLAALLLTWGATSDRVGRRYIFVVGLGIFTVASLGCALSTSPLMLNLARAVQGVGGAAMFATSLALLASAFHGRERGTAVGIWGATIGAAVAIGPLAGGALTETIGWESIFYINVPIGIAAIYISLTRVAESKDPDAGPNDWLGLVTFSGGLFLLIFALVRGNAEGWGSTLIVSFLIGAVVLLVAFVARRGAHPVPDVRPHAVPQADLRRGVHRRLRPVGLDVLDVPVPDALPAERARVVAVPGRRALPAALAAVLRRRAARGAAVGAGADPRPHRGRHGASSGSP